MGNAGKSDTYEGKGKRLYIVTYGCQMNFRDSEAIAEMLCGEGYNLSDNPDTAEVIIFVTCSVRQHAEERVWGKLGMIVKSRRENKPALVLYGCMAQEHKEGVFKKLPAVDIACGPANINDLPELVKRALDGERHILAVGRESRPVDKCSLPHKKGEELAYVNIMYGCNNFCSYCVVPYVRGREASRPMEDIIAEIKELVSNGTEEVMLLGQNVNSYRRGTNQFVELLKKINEIEGLKRIKFTTSHPKDADEELFQAMRDLGKVVKRLHLPVQSGSDKILKLMKRGYTRQEYLNKVKKVRELIPDCEISTDIIVGFPGEKEEDFQDTVSLIEEVKFNSAYIFKYSPRPFTKAALLNDDVPREIKEERHQLVLELQKSISCVYNT